MSGKLHVLIEAKAVYGADKNTTSCAAEMSLPLYEGFQICPFNRTNDTNEDEKKTSVCAIDCIAGPVCPFQCTAAGLGISGKGQARSTNVFTVMTRDEFGNRVTSGGANIAVDIYGGWGVMVDWKGSFVSIITSSANFSCIGNRILPLSLTFAYNCSLMYTLWLFLMIFDRSLEG